MASFGGFGGNSVTIVIEAVDKFSSTLDKAKGSLKTIGIAAGAIAAATGMAINASVNNFAEFNKEIQRAGANVNATADELKHFSTEVIKSTQGTAVSSADAAKAFAFMAGGSVSATDALAALNPTLEFAVANNLDLRKATLLANQAMVQFGIEGDEVNKVFDLLTKTNQITFATTEQLGDAFNEVASMAALLKIPIEDVTTLIGGLAESNILGSEAGVVLKNAFKQLAAPTDQVRNGLDMLGVSVEDMQGLLNDPIALLQLLESRLENVGSDADKVAILTNVFGRQAGPGMASLLQLGTDSLIDMREQLNNSEGATVSTFEAINSAVSPTEMLKKQVQDLSIMLGGPLSEALTNILTKITPVITAIANWIQEHPKLSAAILLVIFGLAALVAGVAAVTLAIIAFQVAASPVLLIVLAIAAAIGIIIAIILYWKEILMFFIDIMLNFSKFLLLSWKKLQVAWEIAWAMMENVFKSIWNNILGIYEKNINTVIDMVNKVIKAMNRVPGVNIPLIPQVNLGGFKAEMKDIEAIAKKGQIEIDNYSRDLDSAASTIRNMISEKIGFGEEGTGQQSPAATTNINIENLNASDPDDAADAIYDKLRKKIGA